jgi:DNA-binding CsgD family transcriptional regulator
MVHRSRSRAKRAPNATRKPAGAGLKTGRKPEADGILSPELGRFFDAMASHFPGHVMQRLMRPDGSVRYTYVSPGIAALGLDRAAILAEQNSAQAWLHPDDAGRWKAALAASAATLHALDEEVRILGVDGRVRWVRSIGNPRRLKSGDVVWDGIALDVTEMREALDAMKLAKAQADTAEAQKARLLAGLEARLAAPSVLLGNALRRFGTTAGASSGDLVQREVMSDIAKALDMLKDAVVRPELDGSAASADPRIAALTPRQREVLALLAEAKSNREIAATLGVTEGTVKLHVVGLLRTLGLNNRTQAATFAMRAGSANLNRSISGISA